VAVPCADLAAVVVATSKGCIGLGHRRTEYSYLSLLLAAVSEL
jgi:hypothetical protein